MKDGWVNIHDGRRIVGRAFGETRAQIVLAALADAPEEQDPAAAFGDWPETTRDQCLAKAAALDVKAAALRERARWLAPIAAGRPTGSGRTSGR